LATSPKQHQSYIIKRISPRGSHGSASGSPVKDESKVANFAKMLPTSTQMHLGGGSSGFQIGAIGSTIKKIIKKSPSPP